MGRADDSPEERRGAAKERARLAWWLLAGARGPTAVNMTEGEIGLIKDLARTIQEHPERWADAPTGDV